VRILVVGASGFIGRRIVEALRAAGHYVIRGLRSAAPGANDAVAIDFDRPASAKQWLSS
jgi:uncharacterized protein YbjT (DUF2867 family)